MHWPWGQKVKVRVRMGASWRGSACRYDCTFLVPTLQRTELEAFTLCPARCITQQTRSNIVLPQKSKQDWFLHRTPRHTWPGVIDLILFNVFHYNGAPALYKCGRLYTMFNKKETPYSWWYLCQILTDFHNSFSGWFSSKFAVKVIKNPTTYCISCHTTLWNISVRKQAVNDILQGSVATYLRCGEIVNNQIKRGLLLSLPVNFFLDRWIFGRVTSKKVVVSCTLCAWPPHC